MDLALNLFLSGLMWAAILFTVASGLSLVFGIMGVINFAHGALYMLGCYLLITVARYLGFWGAIPVSIIVMILFGALLEVSVFRPLYKRPPEFQLLLTFGLVIALEDIAKIIWGLTSRSIAVPALLGGNIGLLGKDFPIYYLFIIMVGTGLAYGIWWMMEATKLGKFMRAASSNREMAQAVGINIKILYTVVFAFGAALAAFGGCLAAPVYSAYPTLGSTMIIAAFIVVVIGHMGSLQGALIGSLIIGILQVVLTFLFPRFGTVAIFAIASVVLIIKPFGLLAEKHTGAIAESKESHQVDYAAKYFGQYKGRHVIWAAIGIIAVIAAVPFFADKFYVYIFAEFYTLALFAVSWNFLYRYSGMLSFGHGAFFAVGAYAYALIINQCGASPLSLLIAMIGAAVVTGVVAVIVGYICTRSTEIYFAILTLVLSMVIFSLLLQSRSLTGGDDGFMVAYERNFFGIDFSAPAAFYYWMLAVTVISIGALWLFTRSHYGHVIMGVRENPERAMFIGLPVRSYRLCSFVIAGFFAGLAGALYAPLAGLITPDLAYWTKGAEALLAAFIGGPTCFVGPIIGAAVYLFLKDTVMAYTQEWRLFLGIIFVLVVLFTPSGILGLLGRLFENRKQRRLIRQQQDFLMKDSTEDDTLILEAVDDANS